MRTGGGHRGEVKYMAENRLRHAHFNSLSTFLLCIGSIPGAALGTGDIAINKDIPILVCLHSSRENLKYKNKSK